MKPARIHRFVTAAAVSLLPLATPARALAQDAPPAPAPLVPAAPPAAPAAPAAPAVPVIVQVDVPPEVISADSVRSAVAEELGAPVIAATDPGAPRARGTLTIAIDHEHRLVISFRDAAGHQVFRSVTVTSDPTAMIATIMLLAGNLARNEADEVLAGIAPPQAPTPPVAPPARPAQPPPPVLAPPTVLAPARQYELRPVSVTFVPFLGTAGVRPGNVANVVSFSAIAGYHGGLNGFELAGVANLESGYANGVQIAGALNVVAGPVRGFQLGGALNVTGAVSGAQIAGVLNVNAGTVDGFQLGGAANVTHGGVHGAQLGGAVNVTTGVVGGLQLAGAVNVATGGVQGVQLAGAVNLAGDVSGLQLAGAVNVARDVSGVQLSGAVNVARRVRGVQIGVVNVADDSDVSIGLFNFVARRPVYVDFSASTRPSLNVALRHGSRHFHNIYVLGLALMGGQFRWTAGLGLGAHITAGNAFVDVDAVAQNVFTGLDAGSGYHLLNELRVSVGHQFAPRLAIYGGISANVMVSERDDYADMVLGPSTLLVNGGSAVARLWPSLTVGLRL